MTKKQGMRSALMALAFAGGLMATAPAYAEGTLTISSPQDPGSWDPVDTFLSTGRRLRPIFMTV